MKLSLEMLSVLYERIKSFDCGGCSVHVLDPMKVRQILQVRLVVVYTYSRKTSALFFPLVS